MIGVVMAVASILFILHIIDLFKIKDLFKRPEDRMAPLFILLGVLTNVTAILGFGKPYTAFYITGAGLVLSVVLCIFLPGLWEWCERLFLIITPLGLGIQYFWNGIRYGGAPERTFL